MRICWIGYSFFAGDLAENGCSVHTVPFSGLRCFSWADLVAEAGFIPDVVVVADKSQPPCLFGMENFPCLTIFYCVDSHIQSWYPYYAQGFDFCLLSLRDHTDRFTGKFLSKDRVRWFPPFSRKDDQPVPGAEKFWDCLFVGKVNAATPGRQVFLRQLGQLIPLHVTQGTYQELYPHGRVILNFCELGDLNFRVFETLGCGGALVTPRIGHGQSELFTEGEHCLMYAPGDAGDAAACVRRLLSDEPLRRKIAASGLAEVNAHHRAHHRAEALASLLYSLSTEEREHIIRERRRKAKLIRNACLRVPYLLIAESWEDQELRESCLAAAKGEFGLNGIERK